MPLVITTHRIPNVGYRKRRLSPRWALLINNGSDVVKLYSPDHAPSFHAPVFPVFEDCRLCDRCDIVGSVS
jgi:hypothetical protein